MMPVINIAYQPDTAKIGQYGVHGLCVKSGGLQKGDAVQAVMGFGEELAGTKAVQNLVFFDVSNIHNAYVFKSLKYKDKHFPVSAKKGRRPERDRGGSKNKK
jgi:hypothetical protein